MMKRVCILSLMIQMIECFNISENADKEYDHLKEKNFFENYTFNKNCF